MFDEQLQGALERQQTRLAAPTFVGDQGQHLHAEGGLQRGVLVELVEHLLGLGAALQLDDDAHAAPVGFVAQVGDGINPLLPRQVRDAFDQAGFVDLVGDLGDNDAVAAARHLFDVGLAAQDDAPLPGPVGLLNALLADNHAAGREIRPGDELHQEFDGDVVNRLVVVDEVDDGSRQFFQVVRWDVGRHADGDAGGTVEQQVGQAGGEYGRLLQRAVEVIGEIYRLFFDIRQHLLGHLVQTRLGVAHGRWRVAVHRAEVALSVHEQVTHGEILRHACHGLVHGRIAVRMVLAEHLADDAGGLLIGGVRADAHVVHGVQNAPVDGLEAVASIRQGAGDDDGHGIVQVRAAHLFVNVRCLHGADDLLDGFRRLAGSLGLYHKCSLLNREATRRYTKRPFVCLRVLSGESLSAGIIPQTACQIVGGRV